MPRQFVGIAESAAMSDPADHKDVADPHASAQKPVIKTWTSAELLGGSNEARIEHGDEVYRLLRTRNDKLILVK